MTTVNDVEKYLNGLYPPELAAEYDNVGLIVGSRSRKVNGVLVCLDATLCALKQAKELGCNLVVSHHPPIFKGMKAVDLDTEKGKIVEYAVENSISVFACHTNFDAAENGLNAHLAVLFGAESFEIAADGALITLPRGIMLRDFAGFVSEVLKDKSLRVCGEPEKIIEKVFVISGAGGREETAYAFAKENADCFMSAEMKHNLMISAVADGFSLIEFSHYHSEAVCEDIFKDALEKEFKDFKIIKSGQQCPFKTMEEL